MLDREHAAQTIEIVEIDDVVVTVGSDQSG